MPVFNQPSQYINRAQKLVGDEVQNWAKDFLSSSWGQGCGCAGETMKNCPENSNHLAFLPSHVLFLIPFCHKDFGLMFS